MINKIKIYEDYGCPFLSANYENVSSKKSVALHNIKEDLKFIRDSIDDFLNSDMTLPFEKEKNDNIKL